MKTWILAAAIAFAAMGPVLVDRGTASAATFETNRATDINIAQVKGLLKLTAAQQPLWTRVEDVLRVIAREQAPDESTGLLHRASRRVVSILFDETAVQRLKNAAAPLLASLDEEQKLTVRKLAQRLGIGDVVAMSN